MIINRLPDNRRELSFQSSDEASSFAAEGIPGHPFKWAYLALRSIISVTNEEHPLVLTLPVASVERKQIVIDREADRLGRVLLAEMDDGDREIYANVGNIAMMRRMSREISDDLARIAEVHADLGA